jgi:hypothetical protein
MKCVVSIYNATAFLTNANETKERVGKDTIVG